MRTKIDTETPPALHPDFTSLQGKLRQIQIPREATLLTVGKLLTSFSAVWDLLNHSNTISDHLFALLDDQKLTPAETKSIWKLRNGDKINRLASTSLLEDSLTIFENKANIHNMSKKVFTKWASSWLLKYNLWGPKKPDRVRNKEPIPVNFSDLPKALQDLWTKYNRLFLQQKANINGMKSTKQTPRKYG